MANSATVSICALDISNTFDRVDHFPFLHLLMDKSISKLFIRLLLDLHMKRFVCVRWGGALSFWYRITAGVRQGGILSPLLLALYMDPLIMRLRGLDLGCKLFKYYGCLLYANGQLVGV